MVHEGKYIRGNISQLVNSVYRWGDNSDTKDKLSHKDTALAFPKLLYAFFLMDRGKGETRDCWGVGRYVWNRTAIPITRNKSHLYDDHWTRQKLQAIKQQPVLFVTSSCLHTALGKGFERINHLIALLVLADAATTHSRMGWPWLAARCSPSHSLSYPPHQDKEKIRWKKLMTQRQGYHSTITIVCWTDSTWEN